MWRWRWKTLCPADSPSLITTRYPSSFSYTTTDTEKRVKSIEAGQDKLDTTKVPYEHSCRPHDMGSKEQKERKVRAPVRRSWTRPRGGGPARHAAHPTPGGHTNHTHTHIKASDGNVRTSIGVRVRRGICYGMVGCTDLAELRERCFVTKPTHNTHAQHGCKHSPFTLPDPRPAHVADPAHSFSYHVSHVPVLCLTLPPLGDDEDVGGGLGAGVTEGQHTVVLVHHVSRHLHKKGEQQHIWR